MKSYRRWSKELDLRLVELAKREGLILIKEGFMVLEKYIPAFKYEPIVVALNAEFEEDLSDRHIYNHLRYICLYQQDRHKQLLDPEA